jgi:hypothetical protein
MFGAPNHAFDVAIALLLAFGTECVPARPEQ